jgi:hypothetical protein
VRQRVRRVLEVIRHAGDCAGSRPRRHQAQAAFWTIVQEPAGIRLSASAWGA